jgi:hypothetical protein
MSRRMKFGDFAVSRERAMQMNFPVPHRTQQAWLGDWSSEAHRMQYLTIQAAEITESLRSLLRFKAKLKKPNLNLEFIKPDVENLWLGLASEASEAAHVIEDTESGFECTFYAVLENYYITGSFSVLRHS